MIMVLNATCRKGGDGVGDGGKGGLSSRVGELRPFCTGRFASDAEEERARDVIMRL